jgi:ribonuclease P protein component
MTPARLHRSAEIRRVYAARAAAHGRALAVFAAPAPSADSRIAVVAGRKVGGAVARNRARRRLRAFARELDLPAALDVVLVARADAVALPTPALRAELARLVARAARRVAGPATADADAERC